MLARGQPKGGQRGANGSSEADERPTAAAGRWAAHGSSGPMGGQAERRAGSWCRLGDQSPEHVLIYDSGWRYVRSSNPKVRTMRDGGPSASVKLGSRGL